MTSAPSIELLREIGSGEDATSYMAIIPLHSGGCGKRCHSCAIGARWTYDA
jgi:hypothetical protein